MDYIKSNRFCIKKELLTEIKACSSNSPTKSEMKHGEMNKFENLEQEVKAEIKLNCLDGKTFLKSFKKIAKFETKENHNENKTFDAISKPQRTCSKYNNLNEVSKRKDDRKHYLCADCSYSSYNRNNFICHVAIHMPRPFKCADCYMKFVRKTTLVKHIKVHKKSCDGHNRKKFLCNICGSGYSTLRNRNRHYAIKHGGGVTKHSCPYCSYSSAIKSVLQHHVLTHTRQRPYKCTHCDRAYARHYSLSIHLTTHTTDKLFICSQCDVKLITRKGIEQHLKNHELAILQPNCQPEKYYRCALCKTTYSKRISLVAHMKAHDRQYACCHCEYVTNWKRRLAGHMKNHLSSE